MPPLIEFQNVSLARDGRTVLEDITLAVAAGEHVAILGPNGSGKSSLIKAITRECYPLQRGPGSYVRIFGQEAWDVFELRSLVGIVSNDLIESCSREFPVMETVLSGFFASIGVWPHHRVTPAMRERAREVVDLLEIGHLAGRGLDELSSGEARRAVIGRALVHRPRALVLDEPTNSLDLRAAHALREILRKVIRSGTSLIVATHHLPDIVPEVERVVCLKGGRIVSDGPKASALTSESLSRLFDTPVEVTLRDGYFQAW